MDEVDGAVHDIHLRLTELVERAKKCEVEQQRQRLEIEALRQQLKELSALLAKGAYTKRAPLPASRTGRIGDDR